MPPPHEITGTYGRARAAETPFAPTPRADPDSGETRIGFRLIVFY